MEYFYIENLFLFLYKMYVDHHMAKNMAMLITTLSKSFLKRTFFLCAYFIVLICLCINLSWIWHKNEFAPMTVFRNKAKLKSIIELRMANYLIETWRSTVEQQNCMYCLLHSCRHLLGWFLIHMWNRIVYIVIKHHFVSVIKYAIKLTY